MKFKQIYILYSNVHKKTGGFKLITCEFELVTRGFELVTRV